MKKLFVAIMAILLTGCSYRQLADGAEEGKKTEQALAKSPYSAEVQALIDKARWGDGQAYLKLADCYRDGAGVQRDFLGMMCMVAQACKHGGIESERNYLSRLSEDDEYRLYLDVMEKSSTALNESKDSIITRLNDIGSPDALAVCGLICVENGDSAGGMDIIRKAEQDGSTFAGLMLAIPSVKGSVKPDRDWLTKVAKKAPIMYQVLGEMCLSKDENGNIDERQAAYYFMKAEENAMLGRRNADWLLSYYRRGGDIQLTEQDIKRLESFIHVPDYDQETIVTDTAAADSVIKK